MEMGYRDKECQIKLRQVLLPRVGGEGMEMVQSLSLKQGLLTVRLQCTVVEGGWLQTYRGGALQRYQRVFSGVCNSFPRAGPGCCSKHKGLRSFCPWDRSLSMVLLMCRSLLRVCSLIIWSQRAQQHPDKWSHTACCALWHNWGAPSCCFGLWCEGLHVSGLSVL